MAMRTLLNRWPAATAKAVAVCLAVGVLVVPSAAAEPKAASGSVRLDGSSTVAPITMAAAEMFQEHHPKVRVTVGISGTGGGFKKFLESRAELRTDVNDASRPITQAEMDQAAKLGVEFIEVPIGLDGLAVLAHPSNTFCEHLTLAELKKIWEPGSTINNWKEVRAGFPDLPLHLYGPGADSGTFDYFTEVVVGKPKASRGDYSSSENDNVLIQGIAGDKGSLGYVGFSYYKANAAKLRLVAVDNGDGKPRKPTLDSIRDGSYTPLSRPMFLYVNKASYARPEVQLFLDYLLGNAKTIVEHHRVGYVAFPEELYSISGKRLREGKVGSVVAKGAGTDIVSLYRQN